MDGLVEKQKFVSLLQYFSPLAIEDKHRKFEAEFYYHLDGTKLSQVCHPYLQTNTPGF